MKTNASENPVLAAPEDGHTPNPGCFPPLLAAALWLSCVGPAAASLAPGPDDFGYSAGQTTAYSFTNITSGSTRVLWFDDDTAVTVNLGFTFSFYGSNYSSVSFNPNGLMTFAAPSVAFANVNLTTSAPSNDLPCIAVLWDDWETQSAVADGVYYRTQGAAGSRQFIVQWNKVVPVNGTGTNTVTFEARLFEGNNQILFSYLDVVVSDETTLLASYGAGATVGIRDLSGQTNNRNLQWSFNQSAVTNGENILFTWPNRPPVAVNDTATTGENFPVTIAVLANDWDPDGGPLTILAVTPPTNGMAAINGGTNITYRPTTGFRGIDSFTYTVADTGGATAAAGVTVSVTPPASPRLKSAALSIGGGFGFIVEGEAGRSYTIQASTNLVDWVALGSFVSATGTNQFVDSAARSHNQRFYRAVTQ